jgi:hypothetical protein
LNVIPPSKGQDTVHVKMKHQNETYDEQVPIAPDAVTYARLIIEP